MAAALFCSTAAHAATIVVNNASFETTPGALPFGCGLNCSYSYGPIPDWAITGASGQFTPGPPTNQTYFNYIPDGFTVAFSNGGTITQTVSALAQAGVTYVLNVDFGLRTDLPNPGTAALVINGNTVYATGPAPTVGNWSTYKATYTATALDAGKPITIVLGSASGQGDWDNVRLSAVPEPATWAMMLVGFLGLGTLLRTARRPRRALAGA